MAFMRKKGECYYVVENHRVNGKVKQNILACLGRTNDISDAIAREQRSLEWSRECASYPWNRDEERWPRHWHDRRRRIGRKLRYEIWSKSFDLDWEDKAAVKAHRDELARFDANKGKHIDAFLRAEHQKEVCKYKRWIAQAEQNLANLWKLVPEADRAATAEIVLQKVRKSQEKMAQLSAAFNQMRGVVPDAASRPPDSGTTGQEDVVPELVQELHSSGTTDVDSYFGA